MGYSSYVCNMKMNYLIWGGKTNLLIINQLGETTKIVTQMFGSSTYFSYLYIYQITKGYGLPS